MYNDRLSINIKTTFTDYPASLNLFDGNMFVCIFGMTVLLIEKK